jgi:hypothetical protein
MAEAADKPKTVKVEALEWHTYNGKAYEVGDTYDLDEQLVDSVTFQGKAARVDRAEVAAAERKRAAKQASASTKVEPMGTTGKPARAPRGVKAGRAKRSATKK